MAENLESVQQCIFYDISDYNCVKSIKINKMGNKHRHHINRRQFWSISYAAIGATTFFFYTES